jgi:hypothetical protein
MQRIESVEELLLNALLAGEKLNVINQQHIRLPVFFAEDDELVVLNGVNILIGEFFRREVRDARALFVPDHVLADRVQQVGFAQADSAVEKERIVGFAGRLGHGLGGGAGEIVVVADDERFKRVLD